MPQPLPTRHHPRVIREILHRLDAGATTYGMWKETGIHHKTIWRWQQRAATNPGWPTDQDIEEWVADHLANGDVRARKAARALDYRKRIYLAGGPLQVDPTGTQRRIRALVAIGWKYAEIGERVGVSAARIGHLASGQWSKIYPRTAATVAAVYDDMCMTVPQDPAVLRRGQIRVRDRQRRLAASRGWAPPLAWDDDKIDDPTAKPYLGNPRDHDLDEVVVARVLDGDWRLRATAAEKRAVIARWIESGRELNELERRTGWNVYRSVREIRSQAVAS